MSLAIMRAKVGKSRRMKRHKRAANVVHAADTEKLGTYSLRKSESYRRKSVNPERYKKTLMFDPMLRRGAK